MAAACALAKKDRVPLFSHFTQTQIRRKSVGASENASLNALDSVPHYLGSKIAIKSDGLS